MIWLFALGIIALCVFNKGFRKVVLWIGGIAGGVVGLVIFIAAISHHQL